jgi:hypothetical protein
MLILYRIVETASRSYVYFSLKSLMLLKTFVSLIILFMYSQARQGKYYKSVHVTS